MRSTILSHLRRRKRAMPCFYERAGRPTHRLNTRLRTWLTSMRASHLFQRVKTRVQEGKQMVIPYLSSHVSVFCLLALCRARIWFPSCFSVEYLGTNRTKFRAYPVSGRQCQLFSLCRSNTDRMTPSHLSTRIVPWALFLLSLRTLGIGSPLARQAHMQGLTHRRAMIRRKAQDSMCGCMRCMQCSPRR